MTINSITVSLNRNVFVQLVKAIYVKKPLTEMSSYEDIRMQTIFPSKGSSSKSQIRVTPPGGWMPPESAILRLGELVDLQIQYLLTSGDHAAPLPNVSECSCLQVQDDNTVSYDFGPDAYIKSLDQLVPKRSLCTVSFMGNRASKRATSTPQKQSRKRRSTKSTPTKLK